VDSPEGALGVVEEQLQGSVGQVVQAQAVESQSFHSSKETNQQWQHTFQHSTSRPKLSATVPQTSAHGESRTQQGRARSIFIGQRLSTLQQAATAADTTAERIVDVFALTASVPQIWNWWVAVPNNDYFEGFANNTDINGATYGSAGDKLRAAVPFPRPPKGIRWLFGQTATSLSPTLPFGEQASDGLELSHLPIFLRAAPVDLAKRTTLPFLSHSRRKTSLACWRAAWAVPTYSVVPMTFDGLAVPSRRGWS